VRLVRVVVGLRGVLGRCRIMSLIGMLGVDFVASPLAGALRWGGLLSASAGSVVCFPAL